MSAPSVIQISAAKRPITFVPGPQCSNELVNRKIRLSAQSYQLAFAGHNFGNDSRQFGGGVHWNLLYAVTIGVQKITRADLKASYLYRFTHVDEVRIRVRNAEARGEAGEFCGLERGKVSPKKAPTPGARSISATTIIFSPGTEATYSHHSTFW
jgi:hypothetical protein